MGRCGPHSYSDWRCQCQLPLIENSVDALYRHCRCRSSAFRTGEDNALRAASTLIERISGGARAEQARVSPRAAMSCGVPAASSGTVDSERGWTRRLSATTMRTWSAIQAPRSCAVTVLHGVQTWRTPRVLLLW